MITGQQLANAAINALDNGITYQQEKCDKFVLMSAIRAGGDLGKFAGSNDMFRNACTKVLPWDEAVKEGMLVAGAVCFIVEPGWSDKYKDSLGKADHIGIITINPEVVHSSESRDGVFASTYKNAWNYIGWLKGVSYGQVQPDEPAQPEMPTMGVIDLPSEQNVFFRISPNTKSAWWGRLNGGQAVEIVSSSNGWTRIRAIGHDGYVQSKFVKMPSGSDLPSEQPHTPPEATEANDNNVAIIALIVEVGSISDRLKEITQNLFELTR